MIDVVVSLRDAVMATLLAWGGVGDVQMANGENASGRHPEADPAVIEKSVEKPAASLPRLTC